MTSKSDYYFKLSREPKAIKNKWIWQYYYNDEVLAESALAVLSTSINENIRRLQKRADLYESEIFSNKNEGEYFSWRLKANNGQVVARSGTIYFSRKACRAGLNKFRNTVAKAKWLKVFKDGRGKKEKYL